MGHIDEHNRTHLALDTSKMNPIDNYQTSELTHLDWDEAARKMRQYRHQFVRFVGQASPKYNCHGLTFGSRRTQVDGETRTVLWILEEDGFRELNIGEKAQAGDVVVYFDDIQEVTHSGIVLDLIEDRIPRVWSKWGKAQEVVHALSDCPYGQNVRFYRIQPWQKG